MRELENLRILSGYFVGSFVLFASHRFSLLSLTLRASGHLVTATDGNQRSADIESPIAQMTHNVPRFVSRFLVSLRLRASRLQELSCANYLTH